MIVAVAVVAGLFIAVLFIAVLMGIIYMERRAEFYDACDRFFELNGYRHHLDPRATIDDVEEGVKRHEREKAKTS